MYAYIYVYQYVYVYLYYIYIYKYIYIYIYINIYIYIYIKDFLDISFRHFLCMYICMHVGEFFLKFKKITRRAKYNKETYY